MNVNPYAPPASIAPVDGADGPSGPAPPEAWDVEEAVRTGWDVYKQAGVPLSVALFLTTIIGTIIGQVPTILTKVDVLEEQSRGFWIATGVVVVIGTVVREYFATGFTRACLGAARTGTARFADCFSAGGRFLPFLALSLVKDVTIGFGLVALVVPGAILGIGTYMARFYVVDQKMGPIAAFRASWAASEGQKKDLFVLWLVDVGMMILGTMTCCIGLFVTEMVMLVARAVVYLRMTGRSRGTRVAAPPG